MVMSVGLKATSQNESAHQLERGEKTESRGPQNIEAPLLFCTWLAESSRFAGVGSPRCVHARLARERTLQGISAVSSPLAPPGRPARTHHTDLPRSVQH